jgi:hypothetical protein
MGNDLRIVRPPNGETSKFRSGWHAYCFIYVRILLANSDALKCRLACRLFEGIQALKPPLQKPQLCGGE